RIEQRPRSGIVENVVTELMIWMNSRVALQLSRAGLPAIYRAKRDIVVSETYTQRSRAGLTVNPREHSGIGAGMYCWVTSPIRRYADLINQRQLGSLIGGRLPAFTDESELLVRAKRMEFQTRTAQIHQRRMERYWTLRWMEQRTGDPFPVTLRRLDNKMLVLFDNLPVDLDLNPEETGQKEGPALFRIEQIDFYALEVKGSVLPAKME
ncbi:MAG: RNB domain-containing ribonuclease, partial [Acidobacteria bacterium]|nr:RNB domain-containing ribonuclease [Acidobacteriota bacterium]